MEWTYLDDYKDFRQAFVKTIQNICFHKSKKFLSNKFTLAFETEFYCMELCRFSETCNRGFVLTGMWLCINAEVFSKYLCIPIKLALLLIDFHGSIQVAQRNIGMFNKFKARPLTFMYFQVYDRHKISRFMPLYNVRYW